MKYKLKPLDQLIGSQGNVSAEVEQIINELSKTAYSLRTSEEIILFLQNHQIALLKKRDTEAVRSKSDEILFFLETNFENFLDDTLPISGKGKQAFYDKLIGTVSEISKVLSTILNPKLLTHLQPLINLNNDYSIYQARFVSNLWKNWQADFNTLYDRYTEENVIKFLVTNNYNPLALFNFIIAEIIGELNQVDDPEIQRQVLESHAKRIRLIPVRIGNYYYKDAPSVYQLVENWLNIELKDCRKKLKVFNPQQQSLIPAALVQGQKIETSLSVAQLALIFRLGNKTGIVTNNTQMEILQAVTNTYSTQKVSTIALESLHNKYYNIEDRTRESVKEILLKMVKALD